MPNLQTTHQSIYKDFFLQHPMVFSCNNVFNRGNGIGESFNNFKIKQKVPSKTYCGITFNTTGEINLKYVYEYHHDEEKFYAENYDKVIPNTQLVINDIKKWMDDNQREIFYPGKWIDISFISENPRGHGFGFLWISVGLISFALHYLTKQVSDKDIANYPEFSTSKTFTQIHHLAWTWADLLSEWKSNGSNIYTAMSENHLPLVYIFNHIKDALVYETQQEQNQIHALSLTDFLGLPQEDELPLDFGIIYFGVDYNAEYIYNVSKNYKRNIENIQEYINQALKRNKITNIKSYLWDLDTKSFYDNFINVWTILHFKLLKQFERVLKKKYDEYTINTFIGIINEFGDFSNIIETENTAIIAIQKKFENIKLFADETLGICPLTLGESGWSFLFVTKYEKSRKTINNLIDELQHDWHSAYLEYCSRKDGYSQKWLCIDQDLKNKIYSSYISDNSILYQDNKWTNILTNSNEVLANKEIDILLDAINNKVYIRSEKLDSKDLGSQSTTVEVFAKLLENLGQEVDNNQFAVSSYSKQRNQMLGKIILPLQELIKSKINEDLHVECVGSLYDFSLTLNEKKLTIWVIREI